MAPKKPFNWWLWTKMLVGGVAISVGGPYLTSRFMISEEEALKKYTPEERKRIMEKKREKDEEFEYFVSRLKEQTKSKQNIWVVEAEERQKKDTQTRKEVEAKRRSAADEIEARKEQMRREVESATKTPKN
ncbi:hypothetical protein GQ53DRAFT_751060 [Thozetella sp. PMI_491]|nr:hypothetical protein GQ53DRAFT_751060 [Thozetella sp. PMI_491]